MMTQFKILLFLLVLNLVSGFLVTASIGDTFLVPGAGYSHPLNGTGGSQFEQEYNASEALENWKAGSSIPILGDLYSGVSLMFDAVRNLVDGFPKMLDWCAGFIPADGGDVAFNIIAYILRGVFAFCVLTLVIEFISGRNLLP